MKIKEILEGKKEWKAHMARVKSLPEDYQIVYDEIQKYLFKVGPVELSSGIELLTGIVDLFEESASHRKGVLDVTGKDVAAFCDELISDSQTYFDAYQPMVDDKVNQAMKKAMKKV